MTGIRLTNGSVLTPDAMRFRYGIDIVVREGRIAGLVEAGEYEPDATEIVDLRGGFVVPGLIDSHYHLVSRSDTEMDVPAVATSMIEGVLNAHDCIASGVTSVRDCGCRHEGVYSLRSAIRDGLVAGPAPYIAGRNPTGIKAPPHWRNIVADGPEQYRAAVRGQHEAGADWVKLILSHADDPVDWSAVTVFVDDDEIAAAVAEAHARGISIGGHCEGWDVAARAVRLGLDSLDHAPLVSDEVAAEMARRGTFYIPTVWAFSDDSGLDDAVLGSENADALASWQAEHRASVRRARAAGVRIAAGSDSADALTGRGVLLKELYALRACGLTPAEVLLAATRTGAELMRRADDLGQIAPGFQADLVVTADDPLADLDALADPQLVMRAGEVAYTAERGIRESATGRLAAAGSVARWSE
jgi:imidazolonepropionase-like amidohydrolase